MFVAVDAICSRSKMGFALWMTRRGTLCLSRGTWNHDFIYPS